MSFLVALGWVVGIAASGLSIFEFLKKNKAPGTIFGVVAVVMILAAVLVSNIPSVSRSSTSGDTLTPTSSNTPQKTVTISKSTQAPKYSPTPTLQITTTSNSTAANGTFTENKLLTCDSCSEDPIQFTIDSIAIDNANGRTVWNVTLKNVSGSYYYVYNNQGITLQASSGTNPPVAATGYSIPQMAPGEKDTTQLIFTFVPREGVQYTFTAHIYTNTNIDMPFDPLHFTFTSTPQVTSNVTPTALAANDTFAENKLLTCGSCSSDPILFTIDSITIDNANARTVWNVTLKNVSGSYYYVYNNQGITLQASAGTDPPVAATGYSVPQMAPGEKDTTQLIFAFVPHKGVQYMFSAHIYTNTNIDMPFDTVNFTF